MQPVIPILPIIRVYLVSISGFLKFRKSQGSEAVSSAFQTKLHLGTCNIYPWTTVRATWQLFLGGLTVSERPSCSIWVMQTRPRGLNFRLKGEMLQSLMCCWLHKRLSKLYLNPQEHWDPSPDIQKKSFALWKTFGINTEHTALFLLQACSHLLYVSCKSLQQMVDKIEGII